MSKNDDPGHSLCAKLCETLKIDDQGFAPDMEIQYSAQMSDDRIENAVQRIEAALSRIADIADAPAVMTAVQTMPPSVAALVDKHEALHETVSNTLTRLDKLIEELGDE